MKKIGLISIYLCCFSLSAHAFSVKHEFNVEIGPFEASRTNFSYSLSPKDFRVASAVETLGIFDTLYPFKADYETSGRIHKNQLLTTNYNYRSQSRFNKRTKELVYDNNGNLLYRLSSKNGRKKKSPVINDDKNADTTDFQSVFAELAKQYNQVHFCDSRMPVFDGKRRFDVIFKDEGKENLPELKSSAYAGEAAKCSMYIDNFDSDDDDDMLMQISSERPIYFWLQEQNGKPFIARVRIDETPLGRLTAYATKITVED